MRRMYSENQLIALIEQYGGQVSPEDIQAMFDDGEVNLFGKYVRIMDAPSSTTLTDEQINQMKEGVFIKGTFATNYVNPIILPCVEYNNVLYGLCIAKRTFQDFTTLIPYSINLSTKKITFQTNGGLVFNGSRLFELNGKSIPSYPANTGSFTLKCVDGVLTWVADAE